MIIILISIWTISISCFLFCCRCCFNFTIKVSWREDNFFSCCVLSIIASSFIISSFHFLHLFYDSFHFASINFFNHFIDTVIFIAIFLLWHPHETSQCTRISHFNQRIEHCRIKDFIFSCLYYNSFCSLFLLCFYFLLIVDDSLLSLDVLIKILALRKYYIIWKNNAATIIVVINFRETL